MHVYVYVYGWFKPQAVTGRRTAKMVAPLSLHSKKYIKSLLVFVCVREGMYAGDGLDELDNECMLQW